MAYSTNWQHIGQTLGIQPIADVSTTQNHPLGTRVRAKDIGANANGEGEFIYLKGVTNGAVGSWVTFLQDNHTAILLAANAIGEVGVLMSALDAATKFGWAQIFGKAVAKVAAAYADAGLVYATATAGTADDAAVAGDRVKNAIGASAIDGPATGYAEVNLYYPIMDDGSST